MIKNEAEAALRRRELDDVLKKWRRVHSAMPKGGWVRAIRDALGMSMADVAKRMKVSQAQVAMIEKSEAKGGIQMSTLRRAAKAMDCAVIYALVPRYELQRIVNGRRRRIALADMAKIMPLTERNLNDIRPLLADYAKRIKRQRVWREEE